MQKNAENTGSCDGRRKHYLSLPYHLLESADSCAVKVFLAVQEYAKAQMTGREYVSAQTISCILHDAPNINIEEYGLALKKICKLGYISARGNGWYMCVKDAFVCEDTYYTLIDYEEYHAIIYSNKKNKDALLLHFCKLVRAINYETKIGFTSLQTLAKREKTPEKNLTNYNKVLRDMKLIAIAGRGLSKSGGKYLTNVYCRYADAGVLKRYARSSDESGQFDDLFY